MDRHYHPERPPTWPYLFLVVMSVASFGGPFLIALVMRGGESPSWPPDRLIEWVVFAFVVSLVLTLFLFSIGLAIAHRNDMNRLVRPGSRPPDSPGSRKS